VDAAPSSLYRGHRYPVEIISHCVRLYHRFPLSVREVEEMLLARGVLVRAGHWCAGVAEAGSGSHPPVRHHALRHGTPPTEVTTDRVPAYPRALDELIPAACHVMTKYANNPIEADHARAKSRPRPIRGLKRLRCARVISAGHAFIQNLRRGHYEGGARRTLTLRAAAAFTELTRAIWSDHRNGSRLLPLRTT
jgi:transposase-like protein